jgi:hypothetical protein
MVKTTSIASLAALVLLAVHVVLGPPSQEHADVLVRKARVYTVDSSLPYRPLLLLAKRLRFTKGKWSIEPGEVA